MTLEDPVEYRINNMNHHPGRSLVHGNDVI